MQASVPVSNGLIENGASSHDAGKTGVRYHAHQQDDDEALGSPIELCDVAVLKITDATTTSVGPALSTVSSEVATAATPPPTPPASVDTVPTEAEHRRRWLDLCHCDRHLIAIKLFYFTFIGALGVCIAYAVIFLKQVGLSAFQIGIISGIRPVLGFISAPAWGALADRYNIRRFLMLVSMGAWLVFFSGLYFVEAPTRRPGLSNDEYISAHDNATRPASAVTVTPNSGTSGTIVDVGHGVTGQNSSHSVTMYVNNCSNF